ncbi:alpha/beta hydrolase [Cognatitamlana onchidii]|uniref:alpha/beta hydrolase n=1 Tax=Cognatitamlana onchidii TaxID=2562860 RepID=UPI001455FF72|nr:alpha/beta hydrolase [Algibacter onchidii]
MKPIKIFVFLFFTLNFVHAQNSKPAPDFKNVRYGDHERNVLDIWFADSTKITPIVIYIHGGGFKIGSKQKIKANDLSQLLEAGISVASINYRLLSNAPLPAAHMDAKHALQFIRSKAKSWKIDKNRIGLFGGSAGAQICMWLAFSDDMANTNSNDPIERESTRVTCIAPIIGQTTMNLKFWKELVDRHLKDEKGTDYVAKIFGDSATIDRNRMAMYGAKTLEEADKMAHNLSALSLISVDDPPVFMKYYMSPNAKAPNTPSKVRGWIMHHVDFGIALKEKMDELNIEADLNYPGSETKYKSFVEFFENKLLVN